MQRLGQVDILVNNAGATWGAPAEDYPIDAWDKVMNLNIRSIFLMSQAIGKASMLPRRAGRIINIASIAGLAGNTGRDEDGRLQHEQGRSRQLHAHARPASGASSASPSTRSRRASSRAR
jgi:NAD(P)-dependent dehydrogenase (short-subunit alcohol dehydrogenase family)